MLGKKTDKTAASVKVGEKGQIVIPKEIRDMFEIVPGDTLLILADKKRGIGIPTKHQTEKLTSKMFSNLNMSDDEEE